ncbi:MAG TPA: hypothetical protein VFZ20_05850, partial [Longimicrobium sp.]
AAAADEHPPFDCRKCGRSVQGEKPDDARWCEACRRALIHSATRRSWLPAAVVAVLYLWLLWWSGLLESPLSVVWLVLGALFTFVAYKVARRVWFDVLRGRSTGE